MKLGVAGVIILLGAACCANPPAPRTIYVECASDAGIEVSYPDAESFSTASPEGRVCRKFADLHCGEAKQPPGAKSCMENVKDILNISNFSVECVEKAKTVAEVRKCPMVKCPQ